MLAPICLFTYSRFVETKQTVEALQRNFLAKESELIIFSDGGKDELSRVKVEKVRQYIRSVSGFKSLKIIESLVNKGLANSIISGVTQVIEQYGKVIVLEDDLLTSPNFLDYMNQALSFYEKKERVLSISGFSFPNCITNDNINDVAFGYRASSWGWGTWKNRWEKIDWEVLDYHSFKWNIIRRFKFNRAGSDMSYMLSKQMNGKINSWAIRFCYHQSKFDMVDVFPKISKVINIGFGEGAENCDYKSYKDEIDKSNKTNFKFVENIFLNSVILKKIRKYNSYKNRMARVVKRFFYN